MHGIIERGAMILTNLYLIIVVPALTIGTVGIFLHVYWLDRKGKKRVQSNIR